MSNVSELNIEGFEPHDRSVPIGNGDHGTPIALALDSGMVDSHLDTGKLTFNPDIESQIQHHFPSTLNDLTPQFRSKYRTNFHFSAPTIPAENKSWFYNWDCWEHNSTSAENFFHTIPYAYRTQQSHEIPAEDGNLDQYTAFCYFTEGFITVYGSRTPPEQQMGELINSLFHPTLYLYLRTSTTVYRIPIHGKRRVPLTTENKTPHRVGHPEVATLSNMIQWNTTNSPPDNDEKENILSITLRYLENHPMITSRPIDIHSEIIETIHRS